WTMRNTELNWAADPLAGVFETTDGAIVIIGAFKENPLRDICRVLEIEDLSLRSEFATYEDMTRNRSDLQKAWAQRLRTQPTDHWVARFEEADILCGPVVKLKDALRHPQISANKMLWSVPHPLGGEFETIGQPIKLSQTPAGVWRRPPTLGEQTSEILSEM